MYHSSCKCNEVSRERQWSATLSCNSIFFIPDSFDDVEGISVVVVSNSEPIVDETSGATVDDADDADVTYMSKIGSNSNMKGHKQM